MNQFRLTFTVFFWVEAQTCDVKNVSRIASVGELYSALRRALHASFYTLQTDSNQHELLFIEKTMRPAHSAQASHCSNATEDQSITLDDTFARRRNFEKASSFQTNGRHSSNSSSRLSANNMYLMNHSLSYTSRNGLDESSRLPHGIGRNDAILEDRPFQQPVRRANVPPLEKLEPQHVDVSAPSRRCLHKPPPPVMVLGDTDQRTLGDVRIVCQSCRLPLWAAKTAIVVRCPQCRTVNSEAACAFMP